MNFSRTAVEPVVAWGEQREEVVGFELPRIQLRPRDVRQPPAQDDMQIREVIVQGRYIIILLLVESILYYA